MDGQLKHEFLVRWVRQNATALLAGSAFVVLGAWEVSSRRGWMDTTDWSSPIGIVKALWKVLLRGQTIHGDYLSAIPLGGHLLFTMARWLAAFVVAALLGSILGFAIGRSAILRAMGYPFVNLLRGLPSAAIWPLCGLTLGYNLRSQMVVIIFGALWPVVINATRGAQSVPQELLDSLAFFQLNGWRRWLLLFRMSLPGIFTGLELGASVAFLLTITVEWLHPGSGGLGWFLYMRKENNEQPYVLGGILIAALLGLGVNTAVRAARERLLPWEPGAERRPGPEPIAVTTPERRLRPSSSSVRDPDVRRLSDEKTHVTERLTAVFPEGWRLEILETACPPYIVPDVLDRLAEKKIEENWYQRDIRIWATRHDVEKVVLFARSWIRESQLSQASRVSLRAGGETIGSIVRAHETDITYSELSRRLFESQTLARAFAKDGVVELLERVRAVRIRGDVAILIQEHFPAW